MTSSRISKFYKLSIEERRVSLLREIEPSPQTQKAADAERAELCATGEIPKGENLEEVLNKGGLTLDAADKIVENVIVRDFLKHVFSPPLIN